MIGSQKKENKMLSLTNSFSKASFQPDPLYNIFNLLMLILFLLITDDDVQKEKRRKEQKQRFIINSQIKTLQQKYSRKAGLLATSP
jgi:hypothetical protein